MTPEDREAAIRQRLEAITKAPWRASPVRNEVDNGQYVIAWIDQYPEEAAANKEFIVAAPDDEAFLLSRLEEVRKVLDTPTWYEHEVERLAAQLTEVERERDEAQRVLSEPSWYEHEVERLKTDLATLREERDAAKEVGMAAANVVRVYFSINAYQPPEVVAGWEDRVQVSIEKLRAIMGM
jgi:hypothetical protein